MKLAVTVMVLLVIFMIAGALPAGGGAPVAVFRSPVFIVLLAILAFSMLKCSLQRLSLRQTGFVLAHAGTAAILAGALLGYLFGQRGSIELPVAGHDVNSVATEDGRTIRLEFGLAATDFSVDYYEPRAYDLYAPDPNVKIAGGVHPQYRFVERLPLSDGKLELPQTQRIATADLKLDSGEWRDHLLLDDGRVLQAVRMPRHYEATVRISVEGGPATEQPLSVNHPLSYDGWRFYLMNYGHRDGLVVQLMARHDPGRAVVIAGIWALIAGVSVLCLRGFFKSAGWRA